MSPTNASPPAVDIEVEKFNQMAKDWWDLKGSQHGLHDMNNIRVPWICRGMRRFSDQMPLEGATILDVGCGGGILTEALARLGAVVVGLEPGEELIRVANEHLSTQKEIRDRVKYVCETIETHAETNAGRYDAVVFSEVIEHISEKRSFVEACVKCTKAGGSVFVTTPNRSALGWLFMKFFGEYVTGLVERGTHDFSLFIKARDVSRLLAGFGCETLAVNGMCYDFYKKRNSWRFGSYPAISYALHAVKK